MSSDLLSQQPALGDTHNEALWRRVREIASSTTSFERLRLHGLHLIAAEGMAAAGHPLAPDFQHASRRAEIVNLMTPVMLERIRACVAGRIVLMKGPEIAARYEHPNLRPFGDLDLLVEDPASAQRALIANGFEPVGTPELYVDHHHLRPLQLPGFPLLVEVHHRPSLMSWAAAPSPAELIAGAVPSATGVDGILALPPAQHAILLAAHGWGHWPLGKALDLVDVMAAAPETSRQDLLSLAREWNLERVWRTTVAVGDAVLGDRSGPRPWPLRTWARPILECREMTPFERYMARHLSPFAALPPHRAVARAWGRVRRNVVGELRPRTVLL